MILLGGNRSIYCLLKVARLHWFASSGIRTNVLGKYMHSTPAGVGLL